MRILSAAIKGSVWEGGLVDMTLSGGGNMGVEGRRAAVLV